MHCIVYQTVSRIGISQKTVFRTVSLVLDKIGKSPAEISVHFIGDRRMRTLNKRYRSIDRTTDVLSFPTNEGNDHMLGNDWGDIFISIPQIQRQAKQFGVSYKEELARMLVHGVLHLFGYDHVTEKDAKKMFAIQETCVKKIMV